MNQVCILCTCFGITICNRLVQKFITIGWWFVVTKSIVINQFITVFIVKRFIFDFGRLVKSISERWLWRWIVVKIVAIVLQASSSQNRTRGKKLGVDKRRAKVAHARWRAGSTTSTITSYKIESSVWFFIFKLCKYLAWF